MAQSTSNSHKRADLQASDLKQRAHSIEDQNAGWTRDEILEFAQFCLLDPDARLDILLEQRARARAHQATPSRR